MPGSPSPSAGSCQVSQAYAFVLGTRPEALLAMTACAEGPMRTIRVSSAVGSSRQLRDLNLRENFRLCPRHCREAALANSALAPEPTIRAPTPVLRSSALAPAFPWPGLALPLDAAVH